MLSRHPAEQEVERPAAAKPERDLRLVELLRQLAQEPELPVRGGLYGASLCASARRCLARRPQALLP
ncbi:MAG: hypothetical protein ACRDLK_08710 [Gaiellaceae bacterium]